MEQVLFEITRNENVAIERISQAGGLVGAQMGIQKFGALMNKAENRMNFKARQGVTSTTNRLEPNRIYAFM